jgi:hypothetical protein
MMADVQCQPDFHCQKAGLQFRIPGVGRKMTKDIGRLALLWRGDREARNSAKPETSRLRRVFEALAFRHIHAEPC